MANELRYLWTLTNGPKLYDRDEMHRRVQAFMRRLAQAYGPIPWVYVLEEHADGAWHAHFIVGRFLPHKRLAQLWGHGWVFVSDHQARVNGNQRTTARELVRRAAGYVAKYVSKSYEAGDGRHGYEVAQGFQPESVEVEGDHLGDVLWDLRRRMGGAPPSIIWDSDEVEDWDGPRCLWAAWS